MAPLLLRPLEKRNALGVIVCLFAIFDKKEQADLKKSGGGAILLFVLNGLAVSRSMSGRAAAKLAT